MLFYTLIHSSFTCDLKGQSISLLNCRYVFILDKSYHSIIPTEKVTFWRIVLSLIENASYQVLFSSSRAGHEGIICLPFHGCLDSKQWKPNQNQNQKWTRICIDTIYRILAGMFLKVSQVFRLWIFIDTYGSYLNLMFKASPPKGSTK